MTKREEWDSAIPEDDLQFFTTSQSGVLEDIYDLDAKAAYDSSGNLVWDLAQTTAQYNGIELNLTNEEITQAANGSMGPEDAWWQSITEPSYVLGGMFLALETPFFLDYQSAWSFEVALGMPQAPLGSGSAMSILGEPQVVLSDTMNSVEPNGPQGYSNDPTAINTLFEGIADYEAAFDGQLPNVQPPAPAGSITPPNAFEKDPEAPVTDPVNIPTEPEPTGTEEEHCTDGEIQRIPVKISTFELYDDNGTPNDNIDDILVGWAVTEYYNHDLTGYAYKTYLYDLDGNLVANLDYDRAELINEEYLGNGGWLLPDRDSQVIIPKAGFQISEVESKAGEMKGNRPVEPRFPQAPPVSILSPVKYFWEFHSVHNCGHRAGPSWRFNNMGCFRNPRFFCLKEFFSTAAAAAYFLI